MTVERALRLTAGLFVMASLALGYWVSHYWFLFTAFVGLNLFQSGLTDWCPAMWIFGRLGLRRCEETNQTAQGSCCRAQVSPGNRI
jgi:hypothetical protein